MSVLSCTSRTSAGVHLRWAQFCLQKFLKLTRLSKYIFRKICVPLMMTRHSKFSPVAALCAGESEEVT